MKKRFVILICVLCAVMMACPFFAACEGNTDNPDKPSYSVSFNVSEMTIEVGETKSVGITFAGGDMVTVKVEPADVASYADGKLTGLKAGTATVTASIGDKSATMSLTVTEQPAEMVDVTIGDKTESVAVGSLLTKPADPKKDPTVEKEYTFDGWYNGDVKWDFAKDTVKGAMTLTARFTESARKYWILMGEDYVEGAYGELLTKPADPTKPDNGDISYTFEGWYTADGVKWNFDTDTVKGEMTLEARFTENVRTYTYTYVLVPETKKLMGVESELFTLKDEDITATLTKGDETTSLEVNNGTVTVTAPRGNYKVTFGYKGQEIEKTLYLQTDGEAKITVQQNMQIAGKAGDLDSFGSNYTVDGNSITLTKHTYAYLGGEDPTDTLYMEAYVEFTSGVGTIVGMMPAAEHKTLSAGGDKLVFSYSAMNRLYYAETDNWEGSGITAFNAYVDDAFAPLTGCKMAVARVGNEYYVFLQDKLFAYYVNDNFGKADFGFSCTQANDVSIKFSNIAYTVSEKAVKEIVEKNGADKKYYANNDTYIGGSIKYPNGNTYASFGANWGLTSANSGYMTRETYIYATNQMANVYYQEAEFDSAKGWVGLLVNTLDGQPQNNKGWFAYGVYHDPSWSKASGQLYLHEYNASWTEGTYKKDVDLGTGDTWKLGVARINNMYYVFLNGNLVLEETVTAYSTNNNNNALAADNASGFGLFRGSNFSGQKLYFKNYEYTTDVNEVAKKVGGTATAEFDATVTMTQNGKEVKSGDVLVPGLPVTVGFVAPEGKAIKSYTLTRDGKTVDLRISGTSLVFTPATGGKYVATAEFADAGESTLNLTVKPVERKAGDKYYALYDMTIDYSKVQISVLNFSTAREQTFYMSKANDSFTVASGYCKITVSYNNIIYSEYVTIDANTTFDYVGFVSDAYLGGKITNSTGEHLSFDKANPTGTAGSNWALVDGRRDTVRVTSYTYAYQDGLVGDNYYIEGTFDSTVQLKIGTNFAGLLVSHGENDLSGAGDKKFEVTVIGRGIFGTYIPSKWSPANIFSIGNYEDAGADFDPTAVRLGVLRDGINYYFFVNDVYVSTYTLPEITFAESGAGVVANLDVDVTITNFNYTVNTEFLTALKATVPQESKKIDVYLIAGQSNASGCTNVDLYGAAETDAHYLAGYDNIYYMGSAGANYSNKKDFGLARAGLGESNGRMGPELGMAKGLSEYYNRESGKKAVMIKYAVGGTSLQDYVGGLNASDGNWCPPSWFKDHTKANAVLSSGLYNKFMVEFQQRWAELKAMGYEPEVKGLYWMQGESDRGAEETYKKLFQLLISDMRADLTKYSGQDCSEMPVFIGEISRTCQDAYVATMASNAKFIAMQNELPSLVSNAYVINNSIYDINALNGTGTNYAVGSDNWHWKWEDAITIGENVGKSIIKNVLSK